MGIYLFISGFLSRPSRPKVYSGQVATNHYKSPFLWFVPISSGHLEGESHQFEQPARVKLTCFQKTFWEKGTAVSCSGDAHSFKTEMKIYAQSRPPHGRQYCSQASTHDLSSLVTGSSSCLKVDSAFHPSKVSKMSIPSLLGNNVFLA